jgi:hypothetical protein
VGKTQQSMVAAALRQAFLQPDRAQASQIVTHVSGGFASGDHAPGDRIIRQ